MDGNGDSRPIARHGRRRFVAAAPLALWALSILGCSQGPAGHRDPVDLEIERLGGSVLRETRDDGRLIVKVDLSGSAVANDDLAVLKTLGKLEALSLRGTRITDAGVPHIAAAGKLRNLDLDQTQVTDAGLASLTGLTSLRGLFLAKTQITDAGLPQLNSLTKLWALSLRGTKVTDAGLLHLGRMSNLRLIELTDTMVTEAALAKLRGDLPHARIDFRPADVADSLPAQLAVATKPSAKR
ncbi:MAG: leucine-rich repeat domain-containing protein [Isosphaeraceae bacterium]